MAWFATIIVFIISLAAAVRWSGAPREHRWAAAVSMISVLGILGVLALQVPPNSGTFSTFRAGIDIVRGDGPSRRDLDAALLFATARPDTRAVAARLAPDTGGDQFINSWLLQLGSSSSVDPIRGYAYSLDPADPHQLCELVEDWGHTVRIHTSDVELPRELHRACPSGGYTVVLHD
jgi:hypothetical protein